MEKFEKLKHTGNKNCYIDDDNIFDKQYEIYKFENSECIGPWYIKEKLYVNKNTGESVLRVCKDINCEYVMKLFDFMVSGKITEDILNEIDCQILSSDNDLSPKIIQVMTNDYKVGIIMEKLKYTLYEMLIIYAKEKNKKGILTLITDVCLSIKKLHELNITHNDMHLGNVMINDSKIYFIDFGLSKKQIDNKNKDFETLKTCIKYTLNIEGREYIEEIYADINKIFNKYK